MSEKKKKKSSFWKILLIMMLIAIAMAAVALAIKSDETGGGFFSSIGKGRSVDEFYYESASNGCFSEMGGGLAVMTSSGLYVFDDNGEERFSRIFSFSSPAMWTDGKYGVAASIGGTTAIFFDADGIITEIETKEPIVSASVNERGYMCLCTREGGYLGSVTVYNSEGTDIYKWYSGSAYVLSADVKNGSELMVLGIAEGGSRLVTMSLKSEDESARYEYSGLLLDAAYTDGGITVVASDAVISLNDSLKETARYSFDGRYLEAFSVEDDFTAVALSDHKVSSSCKIVTVSQSCEETGAVSLNDLDALASSKAGVAVLTDGTVSIYDPVMVKTSSFDGFTGIEKLSMREDGACLVCGTFSARVCK